MNIIKIKKEIYILLLKSLSKSENTDIENISIDKHNFLIDKLNLINTNLLKKIFESLNNININLDNNEIIVFDNDTRLYDQNINKQSYIDRIIENISNSTHINNLSLLEREDYFFDLKSKLNHYDLYSLIYLENDYKSLLNKDLINNNTDNSVIDKSVNLMSHILEKLLTNKKFNTLEKEEYCYKTKQILEKIDTDILSGIKDLDPEILEKKLYNTDWNDYSQKVNYISDFQKKLCLDTSDKNLDLLKNTIFDLPLEVLYKIDLQKNLETIKNTYQSLIKNLYSKIYIKILDKKENNMYRYNNELKFEIENYLKSFSIEKLTDFSKDNKNFDTFVITIQLKYSLVNEIEKILSNNKEFINYPIYYKKMIYFFVDKIHNPSFYTIIKNIALNVNSENLDLDDFLSELFNHYNLISNYEYKCSNKHQYIKNSNLESNCMICNTNISDLVCECKQTICNDCYVYNYQNQINRFKFNEKYLKKSMDLQNILGSELNKNTSIYQKMFFSYLKVQENLSKIDRPISSVKTSKEKKKEDDTKKKEREYSSTSKLAIKAISHYFPKAVNIKYKEVEPTLYGSLSGKSENNLISKKKWANY